MTVYISGPSIGLESLNCAAFDAAAAALQAAGHTPVNPIPLCPLRRMGTPWRAFHNRRLVVHLKALAPCDAILLLPGWHLDTLALAELSAAILARKPVVLSVSELDSIPWVGVENDL